MITPELIEKAAKALCKSMATAPVDWEYVTERGRKLYRADARAVLESILPEVVEMCAKVADEHNNYGKCYAAEAIRSLISTAKEN